MKKVFWTISIFILTFIACSKDDNPLPEDYGCIERIYLPAAAHSVGSSDEVIINTLFNSNQIANGNLRYFGYEHDTFQTLVPPYTKYDQEWVRVDQYTNSLRIFTGNLVYIFWDDHFHGRTGDITNGTSLDTLHQLSLAQLRGLFLASLQQFDKAAGKFKDSCFKAEFGYYNLNAGVSYAPEVLVKAWRVTPLNSAYPSEYPMAFYQDNGKLLLYDNGIQTYK